MAKQTSSLIKYLNPDAVARIAAIGIKPSSLVEGSLVGNHRSPFHGFAIEFAGHRQYVPGDDLKHIDWKLYYRMGRYLTKQYELETNFVAHFVLDVSESMKFEHKNGRKMDYAAFIAVAMASAVVSQTDMAAATLFSNRVVESVPPTSSEEIAAKLSRRIETADLKDKTAIGKVLGMLAEQIGRRKLVFVISDFFGDLDNIFDGVKRLLFNKNEIVLIHVVDPMEIDFDHQGRAELIELEGDRRLLVEGRNIRESYNELFGQYLETIRTRSRKLNIDYLLCNTSENFGVTLAKYLNTRMITGGPA